MQKINLKESINWVKVSTRLPNNGEEVLIAVKNKNKEDGIWLYDIATYYKDDGFEERHSTWEDVLYWSPLISPEE